MITGIQTILVRVNNLQQLPLALVLAVLFVANGWAEVPQYSATVLRRFSSEDARQGIAVDKNYFYAVNNFSISQHDKRSGKRIRRWDGVSDETGPLIHLDSGMILRGKLFAAHSNYPQRPMTSSIEIWDANSLHHIDSHSFGVHFGSFTWIDYYDGWWWGSFANYDKTQADSAYGETRNTLLVKMNHNFQIQSSWIFPAALLQRFAPMSNSGGSWGPDNYLYITGHDHGEIYVVSLPEFGSVVNWRATVKVPAIEGQGIAWDRTTSRRRLWGILKRSQTVVELEIPPVDEVSNRTAPVVQGFDE